MTKKEQDQKTGHQMGKYRGCEVHADGSIQIAPAYETEFDELHNEELAIGDACDNFNDFVFRQRARLRKRGREIWKRLADDYAEFLPDEPLYHTGGRVSARKGPKQDA